MRSGLLRLGNKRLNVFWQFFTSFFVFILIPSLAASLFTYVYVVRLVENEMEKSSEIVIGHFAERTDDMTGVLQNEMIKLLEFSGLDRFLRAQEEGTDSVSRNELLSALMEQMSALTLSQTLASSAYIYVVRDDMVIDKNGHFSKNVYFSYLSHAKGMPTEAVAAQFQGRRMMSFTDPTWLEQKEIYSSRVLAAGRYISAIISYPFNSDTPKAYLVVNIDCEKLRSQIAIPHNSAFETAIVNRSGHLLAYTGPGELNGSDIMKAISSGKGDIRMEAGNRTWKLLDYYSGAFDWTYIGLTDQEELRRPGTLIQRGSAALLCFFLLVGGLLSYARSKKLYMPIRDIKKELESGGGRHAGFADDGNEFEAIRQRSRLLVAEHKDMAELIDGMSPVMHEYFLGKVLLGEFRDELSVGYYAKEIGFDASAAGRLAVLCVEIQYVTVPGASLTETEKTFLLTGLKQAIERRLSGRVWLCQLRKDFLACVVHLDDEEEAGSLKRAGAVADVLRGQVKRCRSAIAVGRTVGGVAELHLSYQQAIQLLRSKAFDTDVQICCEQGEADDRPAFDGFLTADRVRQQLHLYKAGDTEGMVSSIAGLLELAERSRPSAEAVRQFGVDILNTWLWAASADRGYDFSIERYSSLFERLRQCMTWAELHHFFREAAAVLLTGETSSARTDRFDGIVDYIRTNYDSDLTIEQLASRMNMSVGHFSRSFKEVVGEKYIDFLTRCRIDAAKRLLVETDMKLDDIAARVGYLGRSSFIKSFRKYESVTPGKYREAYKIGS